MNAVDRFQVFRKTGALPFQAELSTEFTVTPQDDGAVLRVVQAGFPRDAVADDFYVACERGWHDTFTSIQRYLTSTQV